MLKIKAVIFTTTVASINIMAMMLIIATMNIVVISFRM